MYILYLIKIYEKIYSKFEKKIANLYLINILTLFYFIKFHQMMLKILMIWYILD